MGPYPELRHDLVVSEHRQGNQTVFVVKDPVVNKYFRFVAFQYYAATLLDGSTSLAAIQEAVSDRVRRPVRFELLESFVKRLHSFNLLEPYEWSDTFTETPGDHRVKQPSAPDRKSLLFYTYPLVNPQRMFDRLYPYFSFCFDRPFVIFSILWVLLAGWGLMTDWDLYAYQLSQFRLDLSTILSVYVFLVVTLTIHEMAHGMACRHYGGQVSNMGFLLLFFQPGAYTDVSDSYLFTRKRSRMVVMLAGMYTGVMIFAAMVILWRVTDSATWVHQTSFIMMAVTGWGILFNLNPLIKLDGYYILSDWVDIPNLRQKAFAFLKLKTSRLFGFYGEPVPRVSSRDRRIYLCYGTLAAFYSVLLVAVIVNFVKDFVIEYAPELSIAGLVFGFFAMAVQNSETEGQPGPGPTTEQADGPKKHASVSLRTVCWVVVLCLVVAGMALVEIELRISSPFELRSQERAVVRARIEGQLEHIYVDEGDTVAAGQILVRLSSRDIDAEARTVAAQIDQARAGLALLERGTRKEEIAQARAELKEARVDLEASRVEYARDVSLLKKEVIARKVMEETEADLNRKQAAVEQVQSRLDLLLAGTRREEIDVMVARIEELSATAEYLAAQRQLCEIYSPIHGIVTTRFLMERKDEYVAKGDEICQLIDHRSMLVEMAVPEREVGDVKIGYPVKFKVQGVPLEDFHGEVDAIAPRGTTQAGISVFLVRSRIENDSNYLKPGMTGISRVYCGSRPVGAIMFRRITRYIRTEFWW